MIGVGAEIGAAAILIGGSSACGRGAAFEGFAAGFTSAFCGVGAGALVDAAFAGIGAASCFWSFTAARGSKFSS
jgi:hypothetical protein